MIITRRQLRMMIHEAISPQSVIYCDMDGVLADFAQAAIALVNSILDGHRPDITTVSKSTRRWVRKLHSELGPDWRAASDDDLDFKPVRGIMLSVIGKRSGEYFRDLHPLVDGVHELWPYINSLGMKVMLLSAPIPSREGISAKEGKTIWAMQHLVPRPDPGDIIITPSIEKQRYAAGVTQNILIDDKPRTIDQWNEAGGIGILHVTGDSASTISQLDDIFGRRKPDQFMNQALDG
jgi:hypothetical protein